MQRLFSMFPDGLPGFALLLLRASVAATLLLEVSARHGALPAWLVTGIVALSLLLVLGIFTPVMAVISIALQFFVWPGQGLSGITLVDLAHVGATSMNALALALLGPGAYSLDARRFGRRVVDLPSSDTE